MKRFLLIVLFLLTSIASYGQVIVDANRDPLAARNDGSNITATSAFRAALGLTNHSKITVDSAGRVAIGSTTVDAINDLQVVGPASFGGNIRLGAKIYGNTGSNGRPVFSALKDADTVIQSMDNASTVGISLRSYANNLLAKMYDSGRFVIGGNGVDDGVNTLQVNGPASMTTVYVTATSTFQGDIITGTNCMIRKGTADGADTTSIAINGGGGNSYNRGAGVNLNGNEVTSLGGILTLSAGNVGTGIIKFATDAGVERMRIGATGAVSIATTTPATGYDLTVASGAWFGGAINAVDATSTRTNLGVYSTAETNAAVAAAQKQGALNYYFDEAPDAGDATFERMSLVPVVALASETSAALTTANWVLLDKWLTPIGQPNVATFPFGTYSKHGWVTKSNAGDADIVMELRKITTASVSTLLATSAVNVVTADAIRVIALYDFSIASDVSMLTTDRLEFRKYARKNGSGGDPTLTSWYGDGYNAYFTLPVAGADICRTDGSNIIATSAFRAALGLTNHSKITVDSAGRVAIGSTTVDATNVFQCFGSASISGDLSMFDNMSVYYGTVAGSRSQITHVGGKLYIHNLRQAANADIVFQTYSVGGMTLKYGNRLLLGSETDDGVNTLQVNGPASFAGNITGNVLTPVRTVTATYTLLLADRGALVRMTTTATETTAVQTIIIPPAASVNFNVGTTLNFFRSGAGEVRIIGSSGVTLNSLAAIATEPWLYQKFSGATAICVGLNEWDVVGHIK